MSTLNLGKGLEVLYTFDDADTDSQRNILRDRSGKYNHAQLNGGIGTGNASPVGQAYNADGTDDYLETKNNNLSLARTTSRKVSKL